MFWMTAPVQNLATALPIFKEFQDAVDSGSKGSKAASGSDIPKSPASRTATAPQESLVFHSGHQ